MTEKIKVDQLKEVARILQDIKNGIGTNDNKLRMEAFYTLNSLNQIIGRLEMTKDHQPAFAVGEYYADEFFVYKILEIAKTEEVGVWDTKLNALELSTGKIITNTKWFINEKSGDKPATAEQIATFQRAAHFAKYGDKSVKKTLTIPKYLNALALENHINFSRLLQKALREELQEVENND